MELCTYTATSIKSLHHSFVPETQLHSPGRRAIPIADNLWVQDAAVLFERAPAGIVSVVVWPWLCPHHCAWWQGSTAFGISSAVLSTAHALGAAGPTVVTGLHSLGHMKVVTS